jgi:DHA2 family multidrug resistance protein
MTAEINTRAANRSLAEQLNHRNRWVILVTLVLTEVMELLDTTIANVALPQMAGSLNAGIEEIAWVATGYILAMVIVLPMTAFLAQRFGRKRYLLASVLLFTVASFFCGVLNDLIGVVICRVLQGAGAAALTSTAQAMIVEIFPEHEQEQVQPLFMMGMMAAPIFGPMLGGWLTENASWHWCFLVNVPIGIAAALLLAAYLHDTKAPQALAPVDWTGIALLTVGLGSLQYVLEEGQSRDWFNDGRISWLTLVAIVCLGVLAAWQLSPRNRYPVIDLRVLRNGPLAAGILLFATVGFGVAGISYLYSLLAQEVQGLSPLQTGLALAPCGIAIAASILVCGVLLRRTKNIVDPRLIVLFGTVLTVLASWQFGHLTSESGVDDTFWALILRGSAMGFVGMPMYQAVIAGMKPGEIQQSMALMNLADQIGGSFGIAVLASAVSGRFQVHYADLVSCMTASNPAFTNRLSVLTAYLTAHGYGTDSARRGALQILDQIVNRQAMTMSYNDAFLLMFGFVVLTSPALFLLRRPARHSEQAAKEAS